MKIWKAELMLLTDIRKNEYEVQFNFDEQPQDYEDKGSEWLYSMGWTCIRIPMNITLDMFYGNYKVLQGFDHKLSNEELEQVKINMKEFLINRLNQDKEQYLKLYNSRLEYIQNSTI